MDGRLPEAGEKTGALPAPYGAGQDQTGPTPYPADPSPAGAFERRDRQAIMREPLPPAPFDEKGRAVQRDELAPITPGNAPALAGQSSNKPSNQLSNELSVELSNELWRGLTAGDIEALFASLEIPPRSPALHRLWMRLITTDTGTVPGAGQDGHMTALRAEALDRSGAPEAALELLSRQPSGSAGPVAQLISARIDIGLKNRDRGCETAKSLAGFLAGSLAGSNADSPKRLEAEAIVLAGYCAAAAGNPAGAGIAAELARDNGLDGASGPDILDAIALGAKPDIPKGRKITLADYRMLELAGGVDRQALIPNASPGLLAVLAGAADGDPASRLAAGEAAAALNALSPADLAEIYRANAPNVRLDGQDTGSAESHSNDVAPRRAALFKAIETERTPQRKVRLIRSFLDSARHAGFYWPALVAMAEPASTLAPTPEIGWFAETAIEIALAAGDWQRVRLWAGTGGSTNSPSDSGLGHWIALVDIADPAPSSGQGANLTSVERMALDGRFDPVLLHRLATVLDALDMHIPVPLWQAASRTEQPATGHLPETGVLSALLEASKKKEFGHTVLLAMKTLGPSGAEGAHMIALGDSIRALKRAGLEADARSVGLEALFASWPRSASY